MATQRTTVPRRLTSHLGKSATLGLAILLGAGPSRDAGARPDPLRAPPPQAATLDDALAAVAERVPEFGGMYWSDGQATLQVYLTRIDGRTTAAVQAAITEVFGKATIPAGGLVAERGKFGFRELRDWYARITPQIPTLPGVVATDILEGSNRLLVAVENAEQRDAVVEALRGLSIPAAAFRVVVTGPVLPLSHTLQSASTPRHGGYQITRLVTPSGIAACTMSFNAQLIGGPHGFVTNSHCSAVEWAVDNPAAKYYQAPGFFPAQWIGTETLDPAGLPCGLGYPANATCRWSDSLFAAHIANVSYELAMLGRTTGLTTVGQNMTPIVLTVSHQASPITVGPGRFGIISGPTQPYLPGLPLAKVGRTTGWTQGTLEHAFFPSTCADFYKSGNRVLRCQYVVGNLTDADPANDQWRIASFGDSGSPVFRIRNANKKWVELYGILWGGFLFNNSSGAKKFVFSPIGGVPSQANGVVTDLGRMIYTEPCLPPFPVCRGSEP